MSIHEIRARENPFSDRSEDGVDVDRRFVYASSFKHVHRYSTPSIREEEIRAILRGVERVDESVREGDAFYVANRRLMIIGAIVLGALIAAIIFFEVGTPPAVYFFPVGLAFMYAVLIAISEFRFSR